MGLIYGNKKLGKKRRLITALYFLNSFWREDMLFFVDALANAKSLFSANFLAFPAVAEATLGLLSKMANLALTNPWWLGFRIRLLVLLVSSKTCNFDRTIPSQIWSLCCWTALAPPGMGFRSRSRDSFSTTLLINESEKWNWILGTSKLEAWVCEWKFD